MFFDYVLIDTAPISLYADALRIGRLVDGVILVLEASTTRHVAARRAIDALGSAGVNVLGAVLNKRRFPIPQGLYRRL
jgi:Mrp family chromosome partitioning ATPase